MSGTSIRPEESSHNAGDQLLEREPLQRLQQKVRLVECKRLGDRVRYRDGEYPSAFCSANAVDRIFKRDRLVRLQPKDVERLDVERRLRLRACYVAVGRHDRA